MVAGGCSGGVGAAILLARKSQSKVQELCYCGTTGRVEECCEDRSSQPTRFKIKIVTSICEKHNLHII